MSIGAWCELCHGSEWRKKPLRGLLWREFTSFQVRAQLVLAHIATWSIFLRWRKRPSAFYGSTPNANGPEWSWQFCQKFFTIVAGRCTERFNVWWLALPMTYFRLHEQRLLRLSKHVLGNHKWVVWTRRLMQNFPFFNESSTKRQCRAKSQNRMSLVYTVDFALERNDLWGHVLCSWKAHFKR